MRASETATEANSPTKLIYYDCNIFILLSPA